jgi:uncharacterized membrane protein YcaP (DUF421 family)
MLSIDELASQLRQQQVEDVAEVKLAKFEGDGRRSVLRRRPGWTITDAAADGI